MKRNVFMLMLLAIFFMFTCSYAQEQITITTYYPSPYGSYDSLETFKFGVGDNNGDTVLTTLDVPSTPGVVWVSGGVAINRGTSGVTAGFRLDANGPIRALSMGINTSTAPATGVLDVVGTITATTVDSTAYKIGGATPYNGVINVRKSGGLADCVLTITSGLITGSTC